MHRSPVGQFHGGSGDEYLMLALNTCKAVLNNEDFEASLRIGKGQEQRAHSSDPRDAWLPVVKDLSAPGTSS